MAFTHQVQTTITDGALRISSTGTVAPTAQSSVDETIADATTDGQIVVAVEFTGLTSFFLYSDQDMTVKTNSSTVPTDTIALKAGKPIVWLTGMANTPISADVTSLFVTNASGSSATLKMLAGWDASP